jgi:hypothetical protein
LLASLKTLTNSKEDCSGSRIIISVPTSLSPLVGLLQCSPLIGRRKNPRNCMAWAASGMTFQTSSGFLEAFSWSKSPVQSIWRRLLQEMIFTISKHFIEASRNILLDFVHKKTAKSCENHQRPFLGPSKKYWSRDTSPLKWWLNPPPIPSANLPPTSDTKPCK